MGSIGTIFNVSKVSDRRSVVSDSFATPRAVARQAPLSMEFSRQEYWSGLLFLLHKVSKPWV